MILNSESPTIIFASDHSILITFGTIISRETHRAVRQACTLLSSKKPGSVLNIHPAYTSILVTFDPHQTELEEIEEQIRILVEQKDSVTLPEPRRIEIPVCYDPLFGPDISDVATYCKLGIDDVIRIHSQREYLVYFLGFSPGFPYLGELPNELAVPRLPTPRVKVPEGSVAIGGSQTGIYPVSSPGGWRIIGRTPVQLFLPLQIPPTLLEMGDLVRFVPITRKEYERMSRQVKS